MGVLHVVRCDGPECGTEKPLICSAAPQFVMNGQSNGTLTGYTQLPLSSYTIPGDWLQVAGKVFCSWGCLTRHGLALVKKIEARA